MPLQPTRVVTKHSALRKPLSMINQHLVVSAEDEESNEAEAKMSNSTLLVPQ
jgi:hypothetical protein